MPTPHEEQALKLAARCAIAAGVLPWTFRRMVDRVETALEPYRRAVHIVERRGIELACAPGHGTRNVDVTALPCGRGLDPWRVDPTSLAAETTTTSVCPTCIGNKKVTCSGCDGASRVRCDSCGGGGRVRGQRGLKSCPACRGQGTRSCGMCRNGMVQCGACEGLGRVRAWLELRSRKIVQVAAHPTSGAAALHQDLLSADDFDRPAADYRNTLIADSGWHHEAPPDLEPQLRAATDRVVDRIVGWRVQDFCSSVVRVHYRTRASSGVVAIAGQPLGTLPETTWKPLHQRTLLSVAAGVVSLVLSMMVVGAYTSRAPWFALYGNVGLLERLGFVAAILAGLTVAGLLLPRSARTRLRVTAPACLLAGTCAVMLVAWSTVTPSLEGARRSSELGDLRLARLEAEAVVAEEGPSVASSEVLERIATLEAEAEQQRMLAEDQARLDRIQLVTAVGETAEIVALPWHFEANRNAAVKLLRERALQEIDRSYDGADAAGLNDLARVMAVHDSHLAVRARARAALLEADSLQRRGDFAQATKVLGAWEAPPGDPRANDLHAVVAKRTEEGLLARLKAPLAEDAPLQVERSALLQRIEDAELFTKTTGQEPPIELPTTKKRLATVERKLAKAAQRAERERRRSQESERRRERAAARAARPKPRPPAPRATSHDNRVQCCDGSKSPTCTYDRGSLRGCCSHHGGVC
jgi:hypothetical protein